MSTIIISIILVFLAVQIFPVALGVDTKGKVMKIALALLVLTAIQLISFWVGLKLGNTFMYLMNGFKGVVIFIGFLLIGVRMLMEVFNIRKGERSYSIESTGHIALASLAQGMNTFLVGLMFHYIKPDEQYIFLFFVISTLLISIIGILLKPEKITLAFASLLYTIGGLVMLFSAVYFSFFYF